MSFKPSFSSSLSIQARLLILAIFMTILLVVIGFLGLHNTTSATASLRNVYRHRILPIRPVKVLSDQYAIGVADSLSRYLAGLLTSEEALDRLEAALERARLERDEGLTILPESETDQALLQALLESLDRADVLIGEAREALKANDRDAVVAVADREFFTEIDAVPLNVSGFIDHQLGMMKSEYDETVQMLAHRRLIAILITILGMIVTLVAIVGLGRNISRSLSQLAYQLEVIASDEADLTQRIKVDREDEIGEISRRFNGFMDKLHTLVRRVQHSGGYVTGSVTAISSNSRQLEQAARDFGEFTSQVGTTAKEISATSYELVQTMQDVSQVADNTAQLATHGQQGLLAMEKTMSQMEDAAKSISNKLAVISDKAANITTVVTTITKIADQTNLLSLNASIEAEKAGEYGLGFSVVAREIRRLADQVALATLDIEQMVKEMKTAVSAGVMEMDRFSQEVRKDVDDVRGATQQLNQIIEQVQALLPRFEIVLEGVQAQSEGAQQISDSMSQLTESVEQTNLAIAETNEVAGRLSDAATALEREVSGFEVSPKA
jgi:methyl-accepting chemotaxis protein WspA